MNKSTEKDEKPIIVAWVGTTDVNRMKKWINYELLQKASPKEQEKLLREFDPKCSPELDSKWNNGPLRTMTDDISAEKVYLLCSEQYLPEKDNLVEWVHRGSDAKVQVIDTEVKDPTSYEEIKKALNIFYDKYFDEKNGSKYWFNITAGTTAMKVMTFCAGTSFFIGAKFYTTHDPKLVNNGIYYRQIPQLFNLPKAVNQSFQTKGSTVDSELVEDVVNHYSVYESVTILLTGESGVGKTVLAKEIHKRNHGGNEKNFVYVNCAEIATDATTFSVELFGAKKGAYTGCSKDRKGKFELAQGGTLFLDEIGEIPYQMQSILLNAIQNKEITYFNDEKSLKLKHLRIISATNKNLIEAVNKGEFREDLYYRISMCKVRLSSLREIVSQNNDRFIKLVESTLEDISKEEPDLAPVAKLDPSAFDYVKSQSWPGNLRQLHHVLFLSCVKAIFKKRKCITKDLIAEQLSIMSTPSFKVGNTENEITNDFIPDNMEEWLKNKKIEFIKRALEKTGGNVTDASRILGANYQNLNNFIKNNGLK